jgi:hypothetical protein
MGFLDNYSFCSEEKKLKFIAGVCLQVTTSDNTQDNLVLLLHVLQASKLQIEEGL